MVPPPPPSWRCTKKQKGDYRRAHYRQTGGKDALKILQGVRASLGFEGREDGGFLSSVLCPVEVCR